MRLIDKVVNATPRAELVDGSGLRHQVDGVGLKADAIRHCPLRYILDTITSAECLRLVRSDSNGLFEPDSPLLRLPAETFWLEWFGERRGYRKEGILVESSDGRSGTITGFFEQGEGLADKVGALVHFDLDGPSRDDMPAHWTLRHDTYLHLNPLLACATTLVEPEWDRYFRTRPPAEYQQNIEDVAGHCWYLLPMACAFAAMLNSPDVLVETPSRLGTLNVARSRRGRPPLLDHIEVSIRLGIRSDGSSAAGGTRTKNPPRLHHVRGHFVHRYGKTFWRSAHLRGDAERPILQKTVNVRAPSRSRVSGRAAVRRIA